MKTEIKHTPTPWKLNITGWCREAEFGENQEFIVRAVNSHEALLDVAKLALHAAEGGVVPELFLKTRLKEAIDRAEGEK